MCVCRIKTTEEMYTEKNVSYTLVYNMILILLLAVLYKIILYKYH